MHDHDASSSINDDNIKSNSFSRRMLVASLLCIVNIICYADRTNIGVTIPYFVSSPATRGIVLSSFFIGYLINQIPSAIFATKVGTSKVLLCGITLWTICDVLTVPFAKLYNQENHYLWLLILCRVTMGIGEAVMFPCCHRFAASYFPINERSRLVALIAAGSDIGTILSISTSPVIISTYNWPAVFYIFAGLSVLWIFIFVASNVSDDDNHITSSKIKLNILSQWYPGLVPIFVSHFCFNYGWYVLLSWLPTFLRQECQMDLSKNSVVASAPYVCGVLGLVLSSVISDKLVRHGNNNTIRIRKLMNTIGLAGPALFLFLLRFNSSSTTYAVLMLCLALFTGRASTSGYWVQMIDLSPAHAGLFMSISNTVATVPGIIGNVVTGYILEHSLGNWNLVFGITSCVMAFGAIFYLVFASNKKRNSSIETTPFI